MLTDEERKFLILELGINIVEETWHTSDMRGIGGKIRTTYKMEMNSTEGLRRILERLTAAENTRLTRIEKI